MIQMVMGTLDMTNVELLPHKLAMEERTDLTLYTITKWFLIDRNMSTPYTNHNVARQTNNTHRQGVNMVVILQRNISNELLTTYLPSTLLMIITFATTFFHPEYFEAAVSVNLTTMLVMTTIFIGEMQTLPSTAYVKMIDIWLVFCQLVPFAEVVLLTAIEYKKYDGKEEINSTNLQLYKKVKNKQKKINGSKDKIDLETISIDSTVSTVSTNFMAAQSPIEGWKEKRNTMKWLKLTGKLLALSYYIFFFRDKSLAFACEFFLIYLYSSGVFLLF